MLEACISLRRTGGEGTIGGAEKYEKKTGDIICVKKSPAVWGEMEKKFFLISYLRDDALEATVDEVSVYPYAVNVEVESEQEDEPSTLKMINRSKYRVDLSMFSGSSGLDPTDATSEPVSPNEKEYLELSDMIFDDSDRTGSSSSSSS